MLIGILGFLAVLVIGVLIFAATRPDTFRVQRALGMKTDPRRVFALINDFHQWSAWSPYEHLDPGMKRNYAGAASGQGAVYEWNGNSKAGQGRMEILESTAPSRITIKLDFLKPFEGHNTAVFTLDPRGGETLVTWAMHGPAPFMHKLMQLFINMDRMIGKDFEAGLANLKNVTEKG